MTVKIAHVTTVDLSLRYLLLGQLCALRAEGFDVTGISADGGNVAPLESMGIRHIPVKMTRRVTPLADLASFWRLYNLLRHERFAIVHTHTPKANLLGQIASCLAGIPVRVATVHGLYFTPQTPWVRRFFFRMVERVSMSLADSVFLVNRDDVKTAQKLRLCNRHKIHLLPCGTGIDLRRFDPAAVNPDEIGRLRRELNLPTDAIVIGFVGRLVREKGLLDMFEAFRLLRHQTNKAYLLIVGPVDATRPDAITPYMAQQYGIADRCIFAGPRSDAVEMYAVMDIFVLPSYREGFPLANMEAQAMGVPVVTTDARGCRESIESNVTGLLVPAHDARSLAQALVRLANDAALRAAMGRAGRELAQHKFDQRLAFEICIQEYRRLLESAGLSAAPSSKQDPHGFS